MVLKKEAVLYDRDEKGELLPQEVEVEIDEEIEAQAEYKGEKIKVIPIPRGKLKRLFANVADEEEKDFDGEIIGEHCADPSFTADEIAHIKPILATIIVNTIFRESGLGTEKSKKKAVLKAEDDFAKDTLSATL